MEFFEGKICLITGASRGIGAALARELGRRGASLALLARAAEELEGVRRELSASGAQALALPGDVTRDGDIERLVEASLERFGGIDVVIANAGVGASGLFYDLSAEDLRRVMEVNFFGVVRTLKATLPHLRRRQDSRAAIISSLMGKVALASASAYSASKFALQGLGAALRAEELAAGGPKVTLICPGFVESNIRRAREEHGSAREEPPPWLVMPTAPAAKEICEAIAEGGPEAIITGHAKLANALHRLAPQALPATLSRQILKRLRPVQ